jgi:hypothetical protein
VPRTAKSCGPGTRGWCQIGGDFRRSNRVRKTVNSPMTEAKGIRLRGERAISRQTIAQGRPDALRWTCMLVCALLCAIAHETAGAARTRSSLRPHRARASVMPRARVAPRDRGRIFGVIVRLVRNCALGRTIQYSRDGSDGNDRPRRTGCPAFAEHDSFCAATVWNASGIRGRK